MIAGELRDGTQNPARWIEHFKETGHKRAMPEPGETRSGAHAQYQNGGEIFLNVRLDCRLGRRGGT